MRCYNYLMVALFLFKTCGVLGLTMDQDPEGGSTNYEGFWAHLDKNRILHPDKGYRGVAQGWVNSYGTLNGNINEKPANVKKWWWLLYSKENRPKQQQRKWKKGSTSLVCYFKVCAVPAPV